MATSPDWKCQACGEALSASPMGTAGICTDCGGTSALRVSEPVDVKALAETVRRAIPRGAVPGWAPAWAALDALLAEVDRARRTLAAVQSIADEKVVVPRCRCRNCRLIRALAAAGSPAGGDDAA